MVDKLKQDECYKALQCLYIAVDGAVANDVNYKVKSYLMEIESDYAALEQRLKELEAERDNYKSSYFSAQAGCDALRAEIEVEKANRIADVGVLKVKLAKAQARLTENADEYGRQIQSLHLDVAARDGEIERLKHWHNTADLRSAEIVRLRDVLKAVADIGFTGEDAVDAKAIASKALGGG